MTMFKRRIEEKMVLLLAAIITGFIQISLAENDTYLECPQDVILFRQNRTEDVTCFLRNLPERFNETIHASLLKIQNSCGQGLLWSNIEIKKIRNNNTTSIITRLTNVSLQTSGIYRLKLVFGNITRKQNFTIKVSDIPLLPKEVNFTSPFISNSIVFGFRGMIPEQDDCFMLETNYIATYATHGCPVSKTGEFTCSVVNTPDKVNHHEEKKKYIQCHTESLLVCDDETIKDCQLFIKLMGSNQLGNSTILNVSVPSVKATVEPLKPYFLRLRSAGSSKLTLSWLSPCRPYSYEYFVSYWSRFDSSKHMHTFKSEKNEVSAELTNLKPFTSYNICIEAVNKENGKSSQRCTIKRTKEDIPSKSPVILNIKPYSTRKKDIRRKIGIFWKVPKRQYWNGNPYISIEYNEKKVPRAVTTKNLSINSNNFTLNELFKERGYFIRVNLCTIKGCNHSAWKYVSELPGKKDSATSEIIIVVFGLIFVSIILSIAMFYVWRIRRSNNYGHLEEERKNVDNNRTINEVGRRPPEQFYNEPNNPDVDYTEFPVNNQENNDNGLEAGPETSEPANPKEIYTEFPVNNEDNDDNDLQFQPASGMNLGQLQFRTDNFLNEHVSIELDTV